MRLMDENTKLATLITAVLLSPFAILFMGASFYRFARWLGFTDFTLGQATLFMIAIWAFLFLILAVVVFDR